MSIEAIKHYEAALKEAFPYGASGDVFDHWNKARQAIAEAEKQEPVGDEHQAVINSLPNDSEDKMFMQIDQWARQSYQHWKRQVRGQQITAADSYESHIIWAALRWAKENSHPQPKAEQEPVALKTGECWPEEVMQQWDYWRKEIANGHKGSAPRDWFESLSELRLIDTHPQPKAEQEPKREWVGLTDEDFAECESEEDVQFVKRIEAKLKEKNT